MSVVFLDTVGLIALWDSTDQWHVAAEAAYRAFVSRGCGLATTESVLMECGNAVSRRPYRSRVTALRDALLAEQSLLIPTQEDIEQAWQAFERGEIGSAGIVDHVSFCVMRKYDLIEAFTNDRHFLAAGFSVLF